MRYYQHAGEPRDWDYNWSGYALAPVKAPPASLGSVPARYRGGRRAFRRAQERRTIQPKRKVSWPPPMHGIKDWFDPERIFEPGNLIRGTGILALALGASRWLNIPQRRGFTRTRANLNLIYGGAAVAFVGDQIARRK